MSPTLPSRLAAGALVLALLAIAACGDGEDEGARTTPYGTTPYGTTPYAEGGGTRPAGLDAELAQRVDEALAEGRKHLLSVQTADGSFGDPETGMPPNVGYTAMAVAALVGATPRTEVAGDAAIVKALDWIAGQQKDDGSIWDNPAFVNYTTSAAVGAFSVAKIPAYRRVQAGGRDFLATSQIGSDPKDPSFGGFPYKQDQGQPADLSNVQFALTALADAGLPKNHGVWQRALTYLGRVQNRSESNAYRARVEIDGEEVEVVSGDDGGAMYYPGNSKADYVKRADGTFEARSYGSMTYALLKCLLLAGVDADDPRVVGALGWILRNFTVERNPGFEAATDPEKAGQQGYYYYVFTMARALAEYESRTAKPLEVRDAEGTLRNWRAEMARALLERRRDDGWWVNEAAERWDEGAPVLATSYAMQALAELSGRFR